MNDVELPTHVTGLVVERIGDWRNTKIDTLPLRPLGPGEVLIRCEAAALNFQDLLMIEGKYQFKPEVPFIPGSDVAGVIVATGPQPGPFAVGQRVAALVRTGAFADFAIARLGRIFPIPHHLDTTRAAATTSIFATAVVALSIRGQLQPKERILITGAAGGVGIAAVQYARQLGAEVIALVSSDAKQRLAKNAGANHVLRLDRMADPKQALRAELGVAGIDGVDAVLDTVSGDVFDGAIRCLKAGGRLIVVGFASGRIADVKTNYLLLKGISVVGSPLQMGLDQDGPLLTRLLGRVYEDVAAGKLDPFITAKYTYDQFEQAAAEIANRSALGKIVLVPRAASH